MGQTYQNGEEVRVGDRVRRNDDEGIVVALQTQLPEWGLSPEEAKDRVMIEYQKMGFVCESTETNEDLVFLGRAEQ